jgi:hypothetical protein
VLRHPGRVTARSVPRGASPPKMQYYGQKVNKIHLDMKKINIHLKFVQKSIDNEAKLCYYHIRP